MGASKLLKKGCIIYLLLAIAFSVGYFFLITSFFSGWKNAKFYDDIPDVIFLAISLMILCLGLKIKNFNKKRYVVYGALMLAASRLLALPLQEYQAIVGPLDVAFWFPYLILSFLGFLFILLGFKEEGK